MEKGGETLRESERQRDVERGRERWRVGERGGAWQSEGERKREEKRSRDRWKEFEKVVETMGL